VKPDAFDTEPDSKLAADAMRMVEDDAKGAAATVDGGTIVGDGAANNIGTLWTTSESPT